MNSLIKLSAPLGRVMLAAIFIISGLGKIANYTGTQGYMEAMGVPGALLPLVILTEVAGGLAIAFGWHTRIAAFLLAGFTLLAALIFHTNFADQIQQIMFLKNMAIIGGFLTLIHHGAGTCSLDNRHLNKQD
ncbi:DoxX family protein [Hydrogenovibrio sp. JE_KL2]|jgi:putative oxidoreductase|uniref:DoxX family protein n=1 Tax=Hydrogenovibrio sp. JE_KL2 TaxID=2651188 RepID=UPI00128C08C6|nr:DoxX family protein [Hydrogenovibrio sp. JE_KL2]MPQ76367.1 DoxX family protein [Hydrogenovibrio sp. JE_KL2]